MKTFIDNVQNNDYVGDDDNRPHKSYNCSVELRADCHPLLRDLYDSCDFSTMYQNVGAIVPDRPQNRFHFQIVPLFKLKPTGDRDGRPYVVYMKHVINYTNKIPLGIYNMVGDDGNRPTKLRTDCSVELRADCHLPLQKRIKPRRGF